MLRAALIATVAAPIGALNLRELLHEKVNEAVDLAEIESPLERHVHSDINTNPPAKGKLLSEKTNTFYPPIVPDEVKEEKHKEKEKE